MGECANFCENRLFCYLIAVNAALGTRLSNLPMFDTRSMKTERFYSKADQVKVKTGHDY